MIKLGVGLYRHMLNAEYYAFARQIGCTHVVIHLVDYFHNAPAIDRNGQPICSPEGLWGEAGNSEPYWSLEALSKLRVEVESFGLHIAAIENFDPGDWYDILLDGPLRDLQMERLKEIVRNVGASGIPCIGYNFSIAGVCGRSQGPLARGGALSVGMDGPVDTEMPPGTVWGMTYDKGPGATTAKTTTPDLLWDRLRRFLADLCPVAEEAGVILAAHPDDPPMPTMRGQARLVYQPRLYQDLLDARPSNSNALEFCVGTLGEMSEFDLYGALDMYAKQKKIAYVHLRNIHGTVPHYHETFIDDGDIDMLRVLSILQRNDFDGVIIPDHVPQTTCASPWHVGMAHTIGYIAAASAALQRYPSFRQVI